MSVQRRCWKCQSRIDLGSTVCGECGIRQRQTQAPGPTDAPEGIVLPPVSLCPHGWPLGSEGPACSRCASEAALVLAFPWGDLKLAPEVEVVIGRERTLSPVAEDIRAAGFTNISRRHARVRRVGGAVTVIDTSSTGTWIDGHPLVVGVETELPLGGRLRLATAPPLLAELVLRAARE